MSVHIGVWEPLRPLREYLLAPNISGVYEIGFKKDGYVAKQAAAYGLHGAGYPRNFIPMYMGKHEQSLRKRLGEHFRGVNTSGVFRTGSKGNKSIQEYYRELLPKLEELSSQIPDHLRFPLDGLFFTCIPISDPKNFESLVRLGHFSYPWNHKDETGARQEAEGMPSADFDYIYRQKATLFN